MEEWLNLLSRAPGTGSAGTGWPQEVIDFITCLFEVGFCCLVSFLLSPQWEVLLVTLWSCRILIGFVGWQRWDGKDGKSQFTDITKLGSHLPLVVQPGLLPPRGYSWGEWNFICNWQLHKSSISFTEHGSQGDIVVIFRFHLNVCVIHYGKMCCWRWFWSSLLSLSLCI